MTRGWAALSRRVASGALSRESGHRLLAVAQQAARLKRLVASEWLLLQRIAPDALNRSERWSVFLFVARHGLARVLRYHAPRGDARITLHGFTYYVGLTSGEVEVVREIYRERIYDRRNGFIPGAGWVVFDVGANIGLFSLLQAARGARVYAFEPNAECYRRLLKNIEENGADSISACNSAVALQPGKASLSVPWAATHSGTLLGPVDGARTSSQLVDVTSLDHVVKEQSIDHIDLLKVDAEGSEGDVLRGGDHALAITDRVVLEYHSTGLRQEVIDLLTSRGFALVEENLLYPPDVGVLYAARPTQTWEIEIEERRVERHRPGEAGDLAATSFGRVPHRHDQKHGGDG